MLDVAQLLKAAEAHGDGVGEHGMWLGDLEIMLRAVFPLLTEEQKKAFFSDPDIVDLLETPEYQEAVPNVPTTD